MTEYGGLPMAVLDAERQIMQDHPSNEMSLCWSCRRACGGKGCPWADHLQPNPKAIDAVPSKHGGLLVRRCEDFEIEDTRPVQLDVIKKIIGHSAVKNRFGRALAFNTVRDYKPDKILDLLERYNKIRAADGLRPLTLRVSSPDDDEDDDEEDSNA